MKSNQYLSQSTEGISVGPDYATLGATTAGPAIQALIDLIAAESADATETDRADLNGMMPTTRDTLYAHLVALKDAIGTHVPA